MLIRMFPKLFLFVFVFVFCLKDQVKANNSSHKTTSSANTIKNPFSFSIDPQTCLKEGHQLPLQRALNDLNTLINLGLSNLYNHPRSQNVERYFGQVDQGAELIIPIGILTRLQKGTKKNVIVKCGTKYENKQDDDDDDKDDQESIQNMADDWTVCQTSKRIAFEGGFVEQHQNKNDNKNKKTNSRSEKQISIIICPQSFSKDLSSVDKIVPKRKYLEEICQNDFTLNDNVPTIYWPISLFSLLMQVPQLSSPQMQLAKRDYANVLDLAKRNPDLAKHNIYTYLYFLLDLYARNNYQPEGCSGQPSERVKEEQWD